METSELENSGCGLRRASAATVWGALEAAVCSAMVMLAGASSAEVAGGEAKAVSGVLAAMGCSGEALGAVILFL